MICAEFVPKHLEKALDMARHILGLFHGERGGRAFRQVLSEGAHKPGADWALVEQAIAITESFAQA